MSKFKVGQKVKLNPETKPYTFTVGENEYEEINKSVNEKNIFIIKNIYDDGDLDLRKNKESVTVRDNHIILLEEPTEQKYSNDAIEIRKFIVSELGIEHADRFQEVYEWITGEK